jgi:DMSO/TMAO reductase YedYZ molybdopterin-dependent catalytic subunit
LVVLVTSCSQLSPGLDVTTVPISKETTQSQVVLSSPTASLASTELSPGLDITPVPASKSTTPTTSTGLITPSQSTELTTSPTTNGGLPPILTWQDLSALINSDPAHIDNSKFPITPVEQLGITENTADVDITQYTLSVDGLVDTPLALSYDDILKYSAVSEVVLLICPGTFADNAEWTGVPVTTLLIEAGIKSEASYVVFYAVDGYLQTSSLKDIQQDGVFLAYMVNGQILPKTHGYPIRLVMKGKYGSYWIKWVNRIEIK